jgi:thiamine-monophosphate kinase
VTARLRSLGEDRWIARLARRLGTSAPPPPDGIGDDAARLRPRAGRDLAWTTDVLVEDVHFRRRWAPPRLLGRKGLAVNLSDLAAVGAVPRAFLLTLAAPPETPVAWLDELAAGLAEAARRAGVACAGGDTTASPGPIQIGIAAAGDLPRGRMLTRRGCRPGDGLWLSGPLGGAAAGLRLLEAGRPGRSGAAAAAVRALLDPRPPLALGPWLARRRLARAAIDLSDGLATDLARLCAASGVGAVLEAQAIPVHAAVRRLAPALGVEPRELALAGGEDYELLFAVPPRREAELRYLPRRLHIRPVRIGEVTTEGLRVRDEDGRERPLRPRGFRHFGERW